MKLRLPAFIIAVVIIVLVGLLQEAWSYNPITDVQQNLVRTLGSTAMAGTAYKIAGGGPIANGQRGDSAMFGIFDYRFISASYGAIADPQNGEKFGDGLKMGLKLNYFLNWFKSPQTPVMQVLNNINIGPVFTVPVVTGPHAGALWIEANYQFGK